jgi:hypothetical protein
LLGVLLKDTSKDGKRKRASSSSSSGDSSAD